MAEKKKENKEKKDIYAPEIVPSEELYKLIDDAKEKFEFEGTKEFSLSFPETLNVIGGTDDALASLFKMPPSNRKAALKEMKQQARETIEAELRHKIEEIPDIATNFIYSQMFTVLELLVANFIQPYDKIVIEILSKYNSVIRAYRQLQEKDLKDEARKAALKSVNVVMQYASEKYPIINDVIALIMLIDIMSKTIRMLKDSKSSGAQSEDVISSMKATEEILNQKYLLTSEIISTIVYMFNILYPLIAQLGAATNAAKNFDETLSEENSKKDDSKPDKVDTSKWGSDIITFAENEINGYSYRYIEQAENEISEEKKEKDECDDGLDYSNMCIVDRSGKLGDAELEQLNPPTKAIIEIKKSSPFNITISNSQKVDNSEIIGYVGYSPIKLDFPISVRNIEDNKIFADLDIDLDTDLDAALKNAEDMMNSIESISEIKTDMQKLTEDFINLSNVEETIREYLIPIIYPKIPLNIGLGVTNTTYKKDYISDNYKKRIKSIIDSHKDNMKNICGKEHIENMVNQNKMTDLKDEIISEKKGFFENAFDLYDNYLRKNAFNCETNITNYYLLSDYLEAYYDIEYNENNEYTSELIRILKDFIYSRSIIEPSDVSFAVKSLNELCDEVIKKEWESNDRRFILTKEFSEKTGEQFVYSKDYYSVFRKMYGNSTYDQVLGENKNKDISPEWKELYEFLINLMNVKDDTEKTQIFESEDDLNSLANGSINAKPIDTEKEKIRKQLKSICRRFSIIKEIEKRTKNQSSITANEDVVNKIINQTKYEYDILQKFYEKCKSDYNELKKLYDDETFTIFKKARVENFGSVYYNNEKYQHYFIHEDDIDFHEGDEKFDALTESDIAPQSKSNPMELKYWLLYCAQATIMHCALPNYWACGMNVMGVPLPLPVIYIPMVCIPSSMTIVIGLGICGMYVYPMIICINFSTSVKSVIFPINQIMDNLTASLSNMKNTQMKNFRKMIQKKIEDEKEESKDYDEEIRDIDIEISNLKEQLLHDGIEKRKLKEQRKEQRKEKNEKK